MNLVSWNPFREMDALLRSYGRNLPPTGAADRAEMGWSPSVDISETDQAYLIHAELPGVDRKDIQVSVDNGVLCIDGERRSESSTKDRKIHRVERFHGQFSRRFTLPEDADPQQISATSKDGVLEVHIPRTENKASRAVNIEVQ